MTRKELLKYCRYYKGGSTCPASLEKLSNDKALLWEYEKKWTDFYIADNNILKEYENLYKEAGLADFKKGDKTFISHLAYLFGRYSYWNDYESTKDVAISFKEWHNKYY